MAVLNKQSNLLDPTRRGRRGTNFRKVGLFDHMGFGNLGDAAIQDAFIANIRRRLPGVKLFAFSLHPADTRRRHGIPSYPIRWSFPEGHDSSETRAADFKLDGASRLKSFFQRRRGLYSVAKPVHDFFQEARHLSRCYRLVKSLDVLIMSGGGQLCELYGNLPYNVFKFCALARLSNTPVFMVGVGADLLKRPINKFFARWAVRLANYVSFRSDESQALVRSLGVRTATHVCPDPAYALEPEKYLEAENRGSLASKEARALFLKMGLNVHKDLSRDWGKALSDTSSRPTGPRETPGRRVGINPIGYCDPRRWPKPDDAAYSQYIDKLDHFTSWLLAHNYTVEFFSSDLAGDIFAMEDLKNKLRARHASPQPLRVAFRPLPTLPELLRQMSTFDYVVTSRYHGVIFSHLLGKPVIALSYLPKITDLMRKIGHEEYALEVGDFDTEALVHTFQSLVHNGPGLRMLFQRTSAAYAEALRVEFDRVLLSLDCDPTAPRPTRNGRVATAPEVASEGGRRARRAPRQAGELSSAGALAPRE